MAYIGEKKFIDSLKAEPKNKKAITALFEDADFKKIWNYLRNCKRKIELRIRPGLNFGGPERFGMYLGGRKGNAVLFINPTKKECKTNPMELIDTIIHECIHAVLDFREVCGDKDYPFSKDITELFEDSNIKGEKEKEKKKIDPKDKKYLDEHYGDSASNPKEEYIDINDKAQRLIIKIILKLIKKTGVGKKTLVFKNEEKRKSK
jgi:hypothetical protein